VTTREDQTQAIVGIFHGVFRQLGLDVWLQSSRFESEFCLFVSASSSTAERVEETSMSDSCQPRAGIVWRSFNFPLRGGGDECFLQRLFGEIERAGDTDQRGDDSSVLFAKDLFERLACLRHAGERYTLAMCMQPGNNCRGGPPWPPVT